MSKVEQVLKAIAAFVKAENDDLQATLEDAGFHAADKLVQYVEDFETKIAKLLRNQCDYYVKALGGTVAKAEDPTLADFINYKMQDLFAADDFEQQMSDAAKEFLGMTVPEIAAVIMDAIDTDIPFVELSSVATDWIESWSFDLAQLMNLNTHRGIEAELKQCLQDGEGIEKAVMRIKDLPQFDRQRARTTAITEILTASSVAQQESYRQSPAVVGKTWRHSGSKKNDPRPTHKALDGTTVAKDETFEVDGHAAMYPRDTGLPASERVNCHCTTVPSVDEKILGLSKDEKEKIRQQMLDELSE